MNKVRTTIQRGVRGVTNDMDVDVDPEMYLDAKSTLEWFFDDIDVLDQVRIQLRLQIECDE